MKRDIIVNNKIIKDDYKHRAEKIIVNITLPNGEMAQKEFATMEAWLLEKAKMEFETGEKFPRPDIKKIE